MTKSASTPRYRVTFLHLPLPPHARKSSQTYITFIQHARVGDVFGRTACFRYVTSHAVVRLSPHTTTSCKIPMGTHRLTLRKGPVCARVLYVSGCV